MSSPWRGGASSLCAGGKQQYAERREGREGKEGGKGGMEVGGREGGKENEKRGAFGRESMH